MKVKDKRGIRLRIYIITAIFLLGFSTVLARAYQLQILETDRLQSKAQAGYVGTIKLPPERGTIFDREGHELALSVEVRSVFAHPNRIRDKASAALRLSRILGNDK